MTAGLFHALVGAALFGIGLHGFVVYPHVVRKVLALNVLGSGIFLIAIASAWDPEGGATDPVPQAMVLTGLVVAVSATAFALALACRMAETTGRTALEDDGTA